MNGRDVNVPQETLDLLKQVGTSTLAGQLYKMGFRNTSMIGIQPMAVRSGHRAVGRARTLRFIPCREDLLEAQYESPTPPLYRMALEDIGSGEILVVDAGGSREAAVAGDLFATRVAQRGGAGIIADGVVRDLSAIREVGLPVFAIGTHGYSIDRALMAVGRDEPVRCGEVPVIPGDVIVGDEDGLVVCPPHVAAEAAKEAFDQEKKEARVRAELAAGRSLDEAYPANAEKRKS